MEKLHKGPREIVEFSDVGFELFSPRLESCRLDSDAYSIGCDNACPPFNNCGMYFQMPEAYSVLVRPTEQLRQIAAAIERQL
jgi:hypothetical protein